MRRRLPDGASQNLRLHCHGVFSSVYGLLFGDTLPVFRLHHTTRATVATISIFQKTCTIHTRDVLHLRHETTERACDDLSPPAAPAWRVCQPERLGASFQAEYLVDYWPSLDSTRKDRPMATGRRKKLRSGTLPTLFIGIANIEKWIPVIDAVRLTSQRN